MTCTWLAHDMVMTCSWLSHDFLMIFLSLTDILSKCQVPSSYSLGVKMFRRLKKKGWVNELTNQSTNYFITTLFVGHLRLYWFVNKATSHKIDYVLNCIFSSKFKVILLDGWHLLLEALLSSGSLYSAVIKIQEGAVMLSSWLLVHDWRTCVGAAACWAGFLPAAPMPPTCR